VVCALCGPHLRPGGGVPFEARPLKAGVLLFGPLAAAAGLFVKALELSCTDADAQDEPSLHAATAGRVTLRIENRKCKR